MDSLKNLVQASEGVERINGLLTLADAYTNFQLDTAQLFIDLAQKKARENEYGWALCKSYFIESNIEFLQGKAHIEEIKYIKSACANWFEKNNFLKDALLVRLSRNKEVLYSEGSQKALKDAGILLEQAQSFNDPKLMAEAWNQINESKSDFFLKETYPKSADSTLYYFNRVNDSLKIVKLHYKNIFQSTGGNVPKSDQVKLEKLADRWDNPSLSILAMRIKCNPFAIRGNIDSTTYYVNKINEIELQLRQVSPYWNPKGLLEMANIQANDVKGEIKFLLELIDQNKEFGVQVKLAENLYHLGSAYFYLNEYDLAISYFLESLNLAEKFENQHMINSIKRALGDLYTLTGDTEKAREIYEEVIEWGNDKKENLFVKIMLGNAYASLAQLYQKEENHKKALVNYQHSCDLLSGNPYREIIPKLGLLSVYIDIEEIEMADSLHDYIVSELSRSISYRGKFYFEEGRLFIAKRNYIKGIKSLNTFLNVEKKDNIREETKQANYFLYELYKAIGESDKALLAFENYTQIKDSLENDEVIEDVQKIQSNYEISLKEAEIEKLEQQKEISDLKFVQQENKLALRQVYIVLLFFTIVVLGGIGYMFFKRFQLKKEKEKREIKSALEIESLKSKQKAELAEFKNNLYANISHEFKTPLTLIRVPLQDIKTRVSIDDERALHSVLKNTDYLLEMLDELLGVSQIESDIVRLNCTYFNIGSFLSLIRLNFAPVFVKKSIQFDWVVQLNNETFYADENRLNIVISNLLKNAFSNTSEGGWVKCEVNLERSLIIKVSNKGKNIDPEDLPYVFDRFYRGNNAPYTGSGIGLAWSKQIVEEHNGSISVDNSKKEEVSFSVEMPILEAVNAPISSELLHPNTHKSLKKEEIVDLSGENLPRILIVEDNIEIQEVLKNILKHEFELEFAENGKIGEEMAGQLQPQLVISDVMMPEKNGFELLKTLKESFNTSHIPVILLTARADSTSRVIGLNQNADDYIGKPFEAVELKARIKNLLRQRIHLHKLFSENPLLYSKEIDCSPIDADFLDRARKILESKYSNSDYSVNEFCTDLLSNRTSVNHKLKALTNQTTAEYIKNFRLEKAVRLLIETNKSIGEIYVTSGFNTSQSFNSSFKKRFKSSPVEYRKEFREKRK